MIFNPNIPFNNLPKNPILFIYRGKKGTCSAMTIYRKLHDRTKIRTSKDEFGRVFHKPYPYPGTPHRDVIPGAFFVSTRDEKDMTDFFEKREVPYVRIQPREVKTSNWRGADFSKRR